MLVAQIDRLLGHTFPPTYALPFDPGRARSSISRVLSRRSTHHAEMSRDSHSSVTQLLRGFARRENHCRLTCPRRKEKKKRDLRGRRKSAALPFRRRSFLDGFSAFRQRMRRANPIEFRGTRETAGPFSMAAKGDLRDRVYRLLLHGRRPRDDPPGRSSPPLISRIIPEAPHLRQYHAYVRVSVSSHSIQLSSSRIGAEATVMRVYGVLYFIERRESYISPISIIDYARYALSW